MTKTLSVVLSKAEIIEALNDRYGFDFPEEDCEFTSFGDGLEYKIYHREKI